jgi:crotonobetainyl-CoA:carnitine CoA-transferase CaiB-like acyl-CoA transferase
LEVAVYDFLCAVYVPQGITRALFERPLTDKGQNVEIGINESIYLILFVQSP